MAFPTYDNAYNFYQRYACHAGFDIKKSRTHKAFREVCCTREGKHVSKVTDGDRQRRRPSKKMGCKAFMKLRHNYDGGALSSVVYDVVELQHNHPLTPSPSAVKHMRAHKNRDDTVMQFVDTMQESHVPQSCIMGVLSDLHGGQDNIPFTSRDVENRKVANVRKENANDINKLLEFFNECTLQNPKFYWDAQLDENGVIKNLFWSHASSQVEFADFGDAVTFDTTYKTNIYEMPLAMFVGANHHMQSTLFGCALLRDEKVQSFEWLFNTFNKWHILNRHSDPLNTIFARDAQIEPDMMLCINQTYTPYEFETSWDQFIKSYDLEGCPIMKALYDIREKWVPAFFKKEYCRRMTSTQRSESMNKLVKHKFADHQTALHRFARRMLEVITDRKEKEAAETRACSMSRLYTRAAFRLFEEVLQDSTDFRITQDDNFRNGWCQKQFKVIADVDEGVFTCKCKQWEHTGMFCTHMLRAFVHVQVEKIPAVYILKRYTMKAKSNVPFDRRDRETTRPDGVQESYRTNMMMIEAFGVARAACKLKVAFDRAMAVLKGLRSQVEEIPRDSTATVDTNTQDGIAGRVQNAEISREPPFPPPKVKNKRKDP
ncbi:hypothetical protein OsJ_11726 [Oryza sativa Japonica Group]|uniref:Protein FAR1-RELATED SEQUENCE n=1 Tax=Oryza sativa subsp. japonica TaxID=39947 RepID=B9F9P6_ORYSJ|nr:hypothetical protein OsJ_11726 [Oryza sativa Japonica Group]